LQRTYADGKKEEDFTRRPGRSNQSRSLGASSRACKQNAPTPETAPRLPNLLNAEDLTEAPTRRRMKWGFAGAIAALALAAGS